MIGSTYSSCDLVTCNSNPLTGFHKVTSHGNAFNDTLTSIKNLLPGKYYFRVQTIDQGLRESNFLLDSFLIQYPIFNIYRNSTQINNNSNVVFSDVPINDTSYNIFWIKNINWLIFND